MPHYCTYFDRNFLIQGVALASSLQAQAAGSLLWVLCLDDFTFQYLTELADNRIHPVPLSELEAADPALLTSRANRSRIEYYFTLSPCWPRYLLQTHPSLERITYLDADLFFFGSPQPVFEEMGNKSVLVTEHRYPAHLAHHLRYGRFNVGILSFRNDVYGRECLDRWREQCLDWCHDHVEGEKYADQGYLSSWPAQLGARLCISTRAGVNLAPWNWSTHRIKINDDAVSVDEFPLEIFHFARFRPHSGTFLFQSGQLEYGIMPWRVRQAIYGPYWQALKNARAQIRVLRPHFDFPKPALRGWHGFWKALAPRVIFGSDWWRLGSFFLSGRCGLGAYSGIFLALASRQKREYQAAGLSKSSANDSPPEL